MLTTDVFAGIANALDLTDRILPRLQARPQCRPLLLHFPPYSREELTAIVQDRLVQVNVVCVTQSLSWNLTDHFYLISAASSSPQASAEGLLDASAVQFCARKVSAVSGDARKALDICRWMLGLVFFFNLLGNHVSVFAFKFCTRLGILVVSALGRPRADSLSWCVCEMSFKRFSGWWFQESSWDCRVWWEEKSKWSKGWK